MKSGNQIYKANSVYTQTCQRALLVIVVWFALRAGPCVEAWCRLCAGQRGRGWGCFSIDWRVTMVIPVRLAAMMFSTDGVSVGLLMLRLHNSS